MVPRLVNNRPPERLTTEPEVYRTGRMDDTRRESPESPIAGVKPLETTRLAPSPTGALHLGNARTFLINWAIARQRGWRVVLRIEDLDTPRVKPGAIERTIEELRWLGLDWDDRDAPVLVQSADLSPFADAMERLARAGLAYPCSLTRKEIAAESAPNEGDQETPFPRSLRPEVGPRAFDDRASNWRLVVEPGEVSFVDEFAGAQRFEPARSVGDFMIWTKRGHPAYQLAVVVDDARQGVTRVVRGDDLLDSTARQLLLIRALGLTPPRYFHVPLVRGEDGRRLAKRHGDTRLDAYREAGVPAERVIGLLASWCGIGGERRAMSAGGFLGAFDADRLPSRDVIYTEDDERWLQQAAQ